MENKTIIIMASVRWYNASAYYALYLAQNLKNAGMNVILFGIPGCPLIVKAKEKGIAVIEEIKITGSGIFGYIRNIFKFRKYINKNKIDIFNPHMSRDHIFVFLCLFGKNRNIIRTRTDSIKPKKNIINKIYYNISCSHYIVSSKYMISHISNMGVPPKYISVVPPEMNYKDFAAFKPKRNIRNELNIQKNKIIVSFIGRLDLVKGVEYFIRSYEYLKNKKIFHYIISGEEINLTVNDLKAISGNLQINNISFVDRVEDVRDLLSVTDIGVIPSVGSESICRIGLEMLSFGIPIIGSNINSIPELISEFDGIIVKPGSPEEIAAALNFLANSNNYKRMKKNVLSKIASKVPDKFIMEYLDIFSKVLQK